MKHAVLIALFIISFVSCKKDEPIDPGDSPVCFSYVKQFDADKCDFGVSYAKESTWYEKPCFNPNNPDEFVYRNGNAIWKYTISSRQSELIKDGIRPFTQLDWGSSGWITYTGNDRNVWILMDNGNELIQLTDGYREWGPEFNSMGDRLMFQSTKTVIVDLNGDTTDTFCRPLYNHDCYPWEFCAWSSLNLIAAEHGPNNDGSNYGLALHDLDGNVTDLLVSVNQTDENDDFIQDIEWHPDNSRVFFTDGFGLKVVDVASKEICAIKESCDSKTYFDISISSDGKTILASREISTYSDCKVTSRMELVLMDIDGSNERIVDFE